VVHAALDSDVRFFDTADAYGAGSSERVLGRALSRRRASVTIATKGGYRFKERGPVRAWVRSSGAVVIRRLRRARPGEAPTRSSGYAEQDFSDEYLTTALESSLRRLRTDRVDLYQLHGPRGVDADSIAEWGERMVAAGKIGGLGIGAEDLEQARTWLSCAAVSSVQVPFGLLDREAGDDVIPTAHETGRLVIVRGVFGAGLLLAGTDADDSNGHRRPLIHALRSLAADAGTTLPALAVGFVRSRPEVDVMLVGTTSRAHLGEVATMMAASDLDAGLLGRIDDVLSAHRQERSVG
jgi:aryl-alcohol dehydrogenase-like predicted oxidoreductase